MISPEAVKLCDIFRNAPKQVDMDLFHLRQAGEHAEDMTSEPKGVTYEEATEVAVQLPALSGSDLGYRVLVVVDATGGLSQRTEEAALRRMTQAGASTVSIATLVGDFAQPTGQQAIGILFEMAGA